MFVQFTPSTERCTIKLESVEPPSEDGILQVSATDWSALTKVNPVGADGEPNGVPVSARE